MKRTPTEKLREIIKGLQVASYDHGLRVNFECIGTISDNAVLR